MTPSLQDARLRQLSDKGVNVVDPRQTFLDDDVDLDRVFPEAILFPGTRLAGRKTLVGPRAKIGSEGPATVIESVIGESAEIASGYVTGSVLLTKARIGANGHVREGTLLEEEASTAHAVGLKQTVLMSFVTLGSLINCCDCLVSGGRSRSNHTEVGSGFIHFNFTPWGESGDKATASLFGGVPDGVFLREERIFIGGSSGMVGPTRIGFGSFTTAGQVIRSDVATKRIRSESQREVDAPWGFAAPRKAADRVERNLEYIGHLVALQAWYRRMRKARVPDDDVSLPQRLTLDAAIALLDGNIAERWVRLGQFLGQPLPPIKFPAIDCPLQLNSDPGPHISWVKNLSPEEIASGRRWLQDTVDAVVIANRPSVG
ncbi:UDP-N-acetylglucosamine pyrophosphorylase [Bradyrhizobium sp. USDA 3650]